MVEQHANNNKHEKHEDDGHHNHHNHDPPHDHDGKRPFYCHPVQRQKWGDPQILPHTDWGATFSDLFYVAAAYNLGNLIRFEPTSRGILYFIGLFAPIMMVWTTKMNFNSRYCLYDDIFHKAYEFLTFLTLATAVLFIRPVQIMENPNSYDLFAFSFAITFCHLLGFGRVVELKFFAQGQPVARISAGRDLRWYTTAVLFFIAATIVSGVAFCHSKKNATGSYYPEEGSGVNDTSTGYDSNVTEGGHGRFLAGSTDTIEDAHSSSYSTGLNDATIGLLLAGGVSYMLVLGIMVLTLPGGGKHKELTVPMNIDFALHRYGSFVMVMLGESVLSLLIVEAPQTTDYYATFFCGVVSITLLEYLHFRSQPHDSDDHAMRRSKEAGVAFSWLMFVYCAALVVLGSSYKMMLYELVYEAKEKESSSSGSGRRSLLGSLMGRALAGGGDIPNFDTADRRQRVANLFSWSMAVVWSCSDLMILAHQGIKHNFENCKDTKHSLSVRILGTFLLFIRVAMIACIASVSQFFTEPEGLSFIGLSGITIQVILRVAGTGLFGPTFETDPEFESDTYWPNVTRPAVEEDSGKEAEQSTE